MKKRVYLIISCIFFIFSIFIILNTAKNFTGFVIFDNYKLITSLLGVFMFLISIIAYGFFMLAVPKSLEDVAVPDAPKTLIVISEQARKRMKDPRIKQNLRHYIKEALMIAADPYQRPKEKIGDFNVSPRGHDKKNGLRVAWHFKKDLNGKIVICIDDLLYHKSQGRYVDNWNQRVTSGEINLRDYTGYIQLDTAA